MVRDLFTFMLTDGMTWIIAHEKKQKFLPSQLDLVSNKDNLSVTGGLLGDSPPPSKFVGFSKVNS